MWYRGMLVVGSNDGGHCGFQSNESADSRLLVAVSVLDGHVRSNEVGEGPIRSDGV